MALETPHLWRIACQIHQKLLAAQMHRQQLDLPTSYWPLFLKKGSLSNLAHARSWHAARNEADADFKRFLFEFIGKLQTLQRQIQDREDCATLVSPVELYRDLDALYDEFPEMEYDLKAHQLKITTDSVILEGVDLGSFQIIFRERIFPVEQGVSQVPTT